MHIRWKGRKSHPLWASEKHNSQILEALGEDMDSQQIFYSQGDRYREFDSQYQSVFDKAGEENYFTFFIYQSKYGFSTIFQTAMIFLNSIN